MTDYGQNPGQQQQAALAAAALSQLGAQQRAQAQALLQQNSQFNAGLAQQAQAQQANAFPHTATQAPAPHPRIYLILDVERVTHAVFASETKAWEFVRAAAADASLTLRQKCLTVEQHEVK